MIVFGLDRTLRAGTRIGEAGTVRKPRGGRVDAGTGVVSTRTPAIRGVRLRGERAYFFYADLGPFQTYQHPGRVALVGRRTGRVRVSERLMWPPLIRGRLPAFMRSAEAYHDRRDWAFYRPWREEATARAARNSGPIGLPMLDPPLVDMALRGRVADLLAAERSCVLRFSDTLGHFYDFGAVDRTRGWLGATFTRLEDLNPGFTDERYVLASRMTPMEFAEDVIAGRGCRDVLVYLAGGAWAAGGSAVTVGVKPASARRVRQQFITARQVRSLLRAHRDLTFKVVVDAPYAVDFAERLAGEGNALIVATPGGSRARTFSYLPEVELPGGRLRRHPGNPHGLPEFTNRALFGLERFLASGAEIEHAAAEQAAGRTPSFLAWMLARAFALGADQPFAGEPPLIHTPFTPAPPPVAANRAPTAAAAAASTDEDAHLAIALDASDPDGDPLTYSIPAGPAHGTLTGSGAQRTYTPDADFHGTDGFTFAVADGRGGTAEARVTIKVTPVNDAPQVATSSGSASLTEGGAPVAVDPGLTVADVDDTELEGATVSIGSALAEDALLFTDQNGITGTYDTGVLTLDGTASLADYQAALRSVGYDHTGDDPPAGRTVAFRADDGDGAGPAATRDVAVTPVNDAPTVAASAGSASFIEGMQPVAVDPGVVVGDPDSAFLSGARVDLGSSFTPGEDVLAFTDQNGITGTDNGAGLLTLSGMATVADYQAALRSVTYANTSNNPSTATRTAELRVTDAGGLPSNVDARDITVAGANDTPVVTTTGSPLTYTEGDPATVVDGALTVTDSDDTDLEGATVRVSTGFEAGDELLFTDQSGITGAYDAGTGVLILTGTSSVANYQAALRSVEYRHTGDNPATAKAIELGADDGDAAGTDVRGIDVTRVNDAPIVDTSNAALAYPENAGPVAADAGITVTDPDSTDLSGAMVQITASFVPAQDELAFADQLGITGAYDDTTGTLTLSGTEPVAAYEAALRAITYENDSDDPAPPSRTLTFLATDAEGDTGAPATRDITLAAANDAATITTTATPLLYTEGDPATAVDGLLTVADPDDANLEGATVRVSAGFEAADELLFSDQSGITGNYNAGTGVLTLTGTSSVANYQTALRSIQYRHTGDNPALVKTIELRADDGDGLGPASTRNIDVTRVNDGPQIGATAGDLAYTENDGQVAIDGGLTVTDPDSTQLSGATVTISAGFAGAQDELAFADQLGITGTYDDTTGVLTLTGTTSAANYQTALRSVTYENVSDGPTLTRTITFEATDDGGESGDDTRGIAITAVNDPPSAVNDSGTTDEDTTLNVAAPGVLANDTDVDPGDTKTVVELNGSPTLTGTSAKGATVTINADGSYTYDPGSVFQGLSDGESDTDSFTYTMQDGGGAPSTATVNLTITGVSDAPTAVADTFHAIGNTALFAGTVRPAGEAGKLATGSVLANDTDPDTPQASLVAVPVTNAPTTLGGTITIEADGNFTYHPDDGDAGVTDTFTYTVSDGDASSTGTLSLPIAGQVWYVRNNAASGGDGTSDGHFDTLAEAETASSTGDTVYVLDGDNTGSGLNTGFAMEASERLIGEHSGLSLDPDGGGSLGLEALHAGTPGAHPTLAASNEDVVTLASGATVDGFDLDPAGTGGGISGGAGVSGVTIAEVNVIDGGTAGTQPGVDLDGTTGTSTVSDLTVGTSGATGVRLNNAGTVNFTPASAISITTTGARGLDAASTNMGTSTFDAITVTGSGSGGVSLAGTTGTTTFGDLSLTTTSGATAAFALSSAGTVSVPAAGTANVSATGGPAVDVTGTSGATLGFDAVSSTGSAGDGINLAGLGTGTFTATSGAIGGAAGFAFDLDGGSGTVSYPGALNDGSGQTARITGRAGGVVTLNGAIADTSDAGGGISLSSNTGGATTFGGASKVLNTTTSAAVSFTSSDGHTLTLSGGGLDVDTTSGQGVVATNNGTLTVSGAGNSIASTTGTALDVSNTDLGGATFQSISANGAANGISLDNTGTTAGLTVTGGGSSAQGGDNSGGTIQSTTGHGIALANTANPSFRNMRLVNTGASGVNGTQVSGFSFTDGTITGAGDADDENSITFDDSLTNANLTGVVTITNNVISQTEAEGVDIQNFAGTIGNANISDNALSDTGDVATPGSAVSLLAFGTPTTAANITRATLSNNTITDFRAGVGFQVRGGNDNAGGPAGHAGIAGSGTDVIAITGNSMNGGTGGVGNQPDRFVTAGAHGIGQGNFDVSDNGTAGNRIRNIDCIAIELQADGPVNVTTTVRNNFINANSAVGCAGIAVGTDDPSSMGAGSHTTTISGNNVMGTDGPGIFPIVRASGSTMTARVLNNTVAAPITTNAARAGIRVDSGSSVGDTTLCLEIGGNTTAGSTNTGTATTSPGINLRKQGTDSAVNAFGIEGLSPSPTGTPNVENFVNSQNTSTSGTFGVGGTALLSATSGFTSCVAP